jgi:hypothetical protein
MDVFSRLGKKTTCSGSIGYGRFPDHQSALEARPVKKYGTKNSAPFPSMLVIFKPYHF